MNPNLIIIFCAFLWGVSTFLNRIAAKTTSPFFMQIVVGLMYLMYIPIALRILGLNNIKNNLSNIWIVVLATAISITANILLYIGLKNSSSSGITLVSLYPAIAVTLSAVFLHESLSLYKIIGIIAMILGVIFLSIK